MAFKDFAEREQGVRLLQRSLERGRLAHAYLFAGDELEELETRARTLAKTLNCQRPMRGAGRIPIDCCDQCLNCRKIEHGNHADVHWVRPESKSRVITIDQMRDLMQEIHLKPTEAEYKVAVVAAADRLNAQAANAFLKTLEEPPPNSVLILYTTEPHRILETILSRCLRLNFAGEGPRPLNPADKEWLGKFSDMVATGQRSLMTRYRLLDALLQRLNGLKSATEESMRARSPLERYDEVDADLRDRWESELTAGIEAEYRRQRSDLMIVLQRWLRDVWLHTLAKGEVQSPKSKVQSQGAEVRSPKSNVQSRTLDGGRQEGPVRLTDELLNFPELAGAREVAQRITPQEAMENLELIGTTERLLHTNVQEALALEVGLLKLHL
jgi:DNA polymerase-3 subunit delta'